MKKQVCLAAVLTIIPALLPSLALAHPGHGLESTAYSGFLSGFAHPFTGWDHLLVMLAVGLWAGKLGGSARWQLPLTFMLVMAIGAGLGMAGVMFSGVETAIAASVMAMGLLILISLPLNVAMRSGMVALFALVHGLAHGSELAVHAGAQMLAGMLLATALLHAAGVLLGAQRFKLASWLQNSMGLGILLTGAYMLLA